MKTIEEFVNELKESETLKEELKAIKDKESLEAFLSKNECDASTESFEDYLKLEFEGEISDNEAASSAGGFGNNRYKVTYSCSNPDCSQYCVPFEVWSDAGEPICYVCHKKASRGVTIPPLTWLMFR